MKYLQLLKKFNLKPNFWCAEEYWKYADWREVELECCTWIEDPEFKMMLPPVYDNGFVAHQTRYWASFSNSFPNGTPLKKPLDYEFIYHPIHNMEDLPGKQWHTTRKNIHKIQREHGRLTMRVISSIDMDSIADIVEDWIKHNDIVTIEDSDIVAKYVLNGKNRLVIEINNEIVGIIIYDLNFMYVNFRYCFVRPWPGLSDYARIAFHYIVGRLHPGLRINDGGSLDRESLYKYKKRLCPVEINQIWSTL